MSHATTTSIEPTDTPPRSNEVRPISTGECEKKTKARRAALPPVPTRLDALLDQLVLAARAQHLSKCKIIERVRRLPESGIAVDAASARMHINTLTQMGHPNWSPKLDTIRLLEIVLLPPYGGTPRH